MAETAGKERIYSLDVLRILATFGILFYHFQQVFDYTPGGLLNFHTSTFNWSYLVEFFFVLSGFLAFADVEKLNGDGISFSKFIGRKYARLLPAIILPCACYTVICYIFRSSFGNGGWFFDTVVDIPATLSAMLGIQFWGAFGGNYINYPLWYVDVLLFCYIVMGIIVKLSRKLRLSYVYGFIAMIFLGVILWNYEIEIPFFNMSLARGYYSFFFGLLLGKVKADDKEHKTDKISTMVFCLGVLALSMAFVLWRHQWFEDYDKYIYTFIAYPALLVAFLNPKIQKLFNFKFIGAVGKVTYDVYVWQVVVYFMAAFIERGTGLDASLNTVGGMFVWAAVTWVVGTASYLFFDKAVAGLFKKVKGLFA